MTARNATVPLTGRIQQRRTNHRQIVIFDLQRAAVQMGQKQTSGIEDIALRVTLADLCSNYVWKSILRKTMPGGVPSNSLAKNLRAARSSIRSRNLMNCASRWFGLDRGTPSRSSIAEVEMAQGISLLPSTIENNMTILSNS
jgi:hypothetical protein